MNEIISTQAWACGDKDCRAQWHQRNFWAYSDGTFSVDEYSDGDHETCDESDLPTGEEIDASWCEYAQHVAATGEDPLGNYFVRSARTERQAWAFRFGPSIVGPVLLQARRGRRIVPASELPGHVREYLGLHQDGKRMEGFGSWDEFAAALGGLKPGRWHRDTLEHKAPRKPETIARELRAAARRHLTHAAGRLGG